jgi:hypothetical protein
MDSFTAGAACGDGKQIIITARAILGTTNIGVDANGNPLRDPVTQQPWNHTVQYITVANGAASGLWLTNLNGGSGSITLNSVSPTAAVGSFSVSMVPSPGSGATGTRTVSGQFNVTF